MMREIVIESGCATGLANNSAEVIVRGYGREGEKPAIVRMLIDDGQLAAINLTLDDVCDLILALERQLDRLGG